MHGPSRLVDVAALPWSAEERWWRPPPLRGGAVYELHVGAFTPEGTFDAAIPHLAAIADLGVTHVEVMPVAAFNGTHGWGYDGVAWYAVHEPYGGPEGFARFVDAAHRSGLAVVLDVVYNHLGPSGNYLPDFGPYLTDAYRTPWGDALNLDGPGSDVVRDYIIGNALHWLRDFHVDGLRLDAVHGLVDTSAVHVLAALSDAVDGLSAHLRRPLVLIAESDRCDPLTITPREAGGTGMDAQWADDLHHAIHVAVTGERDGYYVDYAGLPDVAAAYRRGFLYDGRWSAYRERTVGAPLGDVPGDRLVTCVQNHDQVGNRALGERLGELVAPALVRVAAVLLAAAPSTPMLFMGEEHDERRPFQYFTSHPEPELAEAVRNGRREEFAGFSAFSGAETPDPQDPATRERSVLDHARARTPQGQARRALWQDLLRLRREQAALGGARRDLVEAATADGDGLVLVRRDPHGRDVLLTVNLREQPRRFDDVPLPQGGSWSLLLSSDDARYGGGGATVSIGAGGPTGVLELPPRTAALWVA